MVITRKIKGEEVMILLTDDELATAHYEQDCLYRMDEIRSELECRDINHGKFSDVEIMEAADYFFEHDDTDVCYNSTMEKAIAYLLKTHGDSTS